ncbi:MAG: M23 family metallopeptidase, partial [Alistipes sp.]|nr:M23 family metallopeptidase [Alistipes sp.]
MIRYMLTLAALLAAGTTTVATAAKPNKKNRPEAAQNGTLDSLRTANSRLLQRLDSLEAALRATAIPEQVAEESFVPTVDPEQAAADSIAHVQERLRPTRIASTMETEGLTVIDTLATSNDAVQVILYGNNSWKYSINREVLHDETIFEKYWDTKGLFPYREVDMSAMPASVVIELLDSVTGYHCPYQGSIHPRGKYGPRRNRQHQGIDLPLKVGDPIYATFSGRVRISQYNKGGYGNLVIIRHDNGLETYYGHLSERFVEPDQWVEAGQVIGLGGSTGRSSGPHPVSYTHLPHHEPRRER